MNLSYNALSWLILAIAACFDCFTLYIIKWRAAQVGPFNAATLPDAIAYLLHFANHPKVWLGICTFIIGLPLGYVAITRLPLTQAYPVNIALHLSFALIIGLFFLGETLNTPKAIGILLIAIAIYLITTK